MTFLTLVGKPSAEIIDLGPGCFIRELMARRAQPPAEPVPVERYTLRGWADGYVIYDGWEMIAAFHGPSLALASRLLRMLKADAEAPTPDAA